MLKRFVLPVARRALSRFSSHYLRERREPAPTAAAWNAGYESGRWAYLGQLPELGRFSILAGYIDHFARGAAILDVGCGEGVLLTRLPPASYVRYVGIDISESAIRAAIAAHVPTATAGATPTATFLTADCQHYVPDETFDVIVFNEVLYFPEDPLLVVSRLAHALRKGGVLMVSTCSAFKGGASILDQLKGRYMALDETRITHTPNTWSWICTVLAPRT